MRQGRGEERQAGRGKWGRHLCHEQQCEPPTSQAQVWRSGLQGLTWVGWKRRGFREQMTPGWSPPGSWHLPSRMNPPERLQELLFCCMSTGWPGCPEVHPNNRASISSLPSSPSMVRWGWQQSQGNRWKAKLCSPWLSSAPPNNQGSQMPLQPGQPDSGSGEVALPSRHPASPAPPSSSHVQHLAPGREAQKMPVWADVE